MGIDRNPKSKNTLILNLINKKNISLIVFVLLGIGCLTIFVVYININKYGL